MGQVESDSGDDRLRHHGLLLRSAHAPGALRLATPTSPGKDFFFCWVVRDVKEKRDKIQRHATSGGRHEQDVISMKTGGSAADAVRWVARVVSSAPVYGREVRSGNLEPLAMLDGSESNGGRHANEQMEVIAPHVPSLCHFGCL